MVSATTTLLIEQLQQVVAFISLQLYIKGAEAPNEANSATILEPLVLQVYGTSLHLHLCFVWIIDSRATQHVCCQRSLFVDLAYVVVKHVQLPNSVVVTISSIGLIKLTKHIMLRYVLFIPKFHFNLISVSSLTRNNNRCVLFYDTTCFI